MHEASEQLAKILIVDDKVANLKTLETVIASLQLNVATVRATSGNEALGKALEDDFAIVLLDVQMPGMDGFEVASLMRSDERLKHVPIIFITAGSKDFSKTMHGYGSGAVDFLYKPFNPYILGSKIRIFVDLYFQKKKLQNQILTIERQKLEVDLLRQKAETASNFKSRFVANMSHEIRTPLGAILGYSEILDTMPDDAQLVDLRKFVQPIMRNGQLLLSLVNSVLDFSKIESGCLDIEVTEVVIGDVLDDIRTMFELKSRDKGIDFIVEESELFSAKILSDNLRLKQILINLIGNALKYTEDGFVKVTLDSRAKTNSVGHLIDIYIEDTGAGIEKEYHRHIFSPYGQVEGDVLKAQGTGLGLPIARELALSLGGDLILVRSEVGQGSVFQLTIDSVSKDIKSNLGFAAVAGTTGESAAPKQSQVRNAHTLQGYRILLVDDAVDMRKAVELVLKRSGALVEVANDGKQAIETAESGDYDAIIMDVQMPVMNGPEAVEYLRAKGYRKPIIALTAHAFDNEYVKCLESGYSDYLTKPVDFDKLTKMLIALHHKSEQATSQTSNGATQHHNTDFKRLGSPYEDDNELLPILSSFLRDTQSHLTTLQDELTNRNLEPSLRIIHTLRGTAGSLGYYRLAALILSLENSVKSGKLVAALSQLDSIIDVYGQTVAYFNLKHQNNRVDL